MYRSGYIDSDDQTLKYLGMALAALLLVGCGIYFAVTYRREVKEQVVAISWSRSIDIQTWMTVQESDWSVPAEGRQTGSFSAIHHYDHVYTGSTTDCDWVGTGSSRHQSCTTTAHYRDDPVYRTKYNYDIERWVTTRTPELHGSDHDVEWPDVSDIKTAPTLQIGNQRVGTHYSRYTVVFSHDYSLDITEERWAKLNIGDKRTIVVNIFNRPQDFKEGWS